METLVRMRPADLADLGTVKEPPGKTLKGLHEVQCILMLKQVHKCVAEVDAVPKVHGQVHEIVGRLEVVLVQQGEQHSLRVPVREVSQHDRRFRSRSRTVNGNLRSRNLGWCAARLHLPSHCTSPASSSAIAPWMLLVLLLRLLEPTGPAAATTPLPSGVGLIAPPPTSARLLLRQRGWRKSSPGVAPRHSREPREGRRCSGRHPRVGPRRRKRPRKPGERWHAHTARMAQGIISVVAQGSRSR
mmetsp:Transcript_21048/g.57527  ORF Transcript_21048/g.57527 Transcript_21048/m.57527 type:complete len:244 (+) Transcript_21048:312-1043(+)